VRHLFSLIVFGLTAGCDSVTPQEKAMQDARDVAEVQAVQKMKPPLQPLTPQPVSPNVRRVFQLSDEGCDFGTGTRLLLVAGRSKAVLVIDGEPAILAADSGSATLPAGIHARYVGRTHWAHLTHDPDTLTIRDRFERIVYQSAGRLTCHG
jgi:hypothetical protein